MQIIIIFKGFIFSKLFHESEMKFMQQNALFSISNWVHELMFGKIPNVSIVRVYVQVHIHVRILRI